MKPLTTYLTQHLFVYGASAISCLQVSAARLQFIIRKGSFYILVLRLKPKSRWLWICMASVLFHPRQHSVTRRQGQYRSALPSSEGSLCSKSISDSRVWPSCSHGSLRPVLLERQRYDTTQHTQKPETSLEVHIGRVPVMYALSFLLFQTTVCSCESSLLARLEPRVLKSKCAVGNRFGRSMLPVGKRNAAPPTQYHPVGHARPDQFAVPQALCVGTNWSGLAWPTRWYCRWACLMFQSLHSGISVQGQCIEHLSKSSKSLP